MPRKKNCHICNQKLESAIEQRNKTCWVCTRLANSVKSEVQEVLVNE